MGLRQVIATAVLALACASAAPAFGQAELLSEHSAWGAYTTQDNTGRICFVMSAPTSTSPQAAVTGEAYLYVTHRVGSAIRNELNLVSGYVFAPDSPVTAAVGSQSFSMVTAGEGAWLADPAQSQAVVTAMRAGSTMTFTGSSAAGGQVTQSFSLMGITAATNRINEAC